MLFCESFFLETTSKNYAREWNARDIQVLLQEPMRFQEVYKHCSPPPPFQPPRGRVGVGNPLLRFSQGKIYLLCIIIIFIKNYLYYFIMYIYCLIFFLRPEKHSSPTWRNFESSLAFFPSIPNLQPLLTSQGPCLYAHSNFKKKF